MEYKIKTMGNKIRNFADLETWKEGHKLVLKIYKLTKDFPKEERFGLIDQMRRAVVSITSNIAEGFSRQSKKEKAQFFLISKGSLTELQNQLLISKDVHYLKLEDFSDVIKLTVQVKKLLNGLIRYCKNS
jgi:four helix bundle protein